MYTSSAFFKIDEMICYLWTENRNSSLNIFFLFSKPIAIRKIDKAMWTFSRDFFVEPTVEYIYHKVGVIFVTASSKTK